MVNGFNASHGDGSLWNVSYNLLLCQYALGQTAHPVFTSIDTVIKLYTYSMYRNTRKQVIYKKLTHIMALATTSKRNILEHTLMNTTGIYCTSFSMCTLL